MESIMELDELKQAWQTLDRRIEQQNALTLRAFRNTTLDKARSRLRPLFWGQVLQIACGALLALAAGSFWPDHLAVPHLLVSGLIVHAYAIAMIVLAARTLWLIAHIDYAAPVVVIQKQLGRLRRFYIISGMFVGLAWWLFWMPFMEMVFMGLFGADLYRNAPTLIHISIVTGIVGLLATWWFHRWSRKPSRPRLAKAMQDSVTGSSLRRAQAELDEVARFESE